VPIVQTDVTRNVTLALRWVASNVTLQCARWTATSPWCGFATGQRHLCVWEPV